MPLLADRVLESTTTTGTGTFSLDGALTGYRSFNSAFSNGDVVYYTADNGQGEWEVGYGTVGTGTLSRDTVLESSNANALVVFSAGAKRIFCTAPAKQLPPNQTGNSGKYLTTDGSALSWGTVTTGTVTSVDVTVPTGFSVSGSPVTTSGTIAISTTLSGVLKGTGSGFTAATAGTDYVAPSGALGTPSSGTLTNCSGLPLTTGITGTLPVANGGTGATSLTANNVLLGNGTSALQSVAPGTAGNVLTSDGTTWTSTAGSSGSSITAIASGSLSDGTKVVVNSDGTVSAIAATPLATPTITNLGAYASAVSGVGPSIAYNPTGNVVLIGYVASSTGYPTVVAGSISNGVVTFGTPVTVRSSSSGAPTCVYNAAAGRFAVVWQDSTSLYAMYGVSCAVSGNTVTAGTATDLTGTNTSVLAEGVSVGSYVYVAVSYPLLSPAPRIAVIGFSGSSITIANNATMPSGYYPAALTYDATNNRLVATGYNSSIYGTACVFTISGSSLSAGTPVVFYSASINGNGYITFDSTAGKVIITYMDGSTSYARCIVGTVSGTSISFGTELVYRSASTSLPYCQYDPITNRTLLIASASGTNYHYLATVSGTSISVGSSTLGSGYMATLVYASGLGKIVYPTASTIALNAVNTYTTNLTASNYIGISNAAYTNGQTATIQTIGAVDDAQSGLTAGIPYYVQVNGTLSTTAGSPSVFAGTAISATKIIVKG